MRIRHTIALLLPPVPTDPDKPAVELNRVAPLFPPDYAAGELHGVTGRSKDIFVAWAANNDKRTIVSEQTGDNVYTLKWSVGGPMQ
jgi:hypothetical protein